ncbi:hypothetical protein ACFXOD_33945 [Streptomyces sp. NPDC059161]|uniref:hypothetical protein n=1 Tax=Streptomyces sp. NPDC059161 TaxID=3346749 RepID=UPI00369092BC
MSRAGLSPRHHDWSPCHLIIRTAALYAKARADGERSVRTQAFDVMATEEWELVRGVWQETELLL